MKFENTETLLKAIGDGYWELDIRNQKLEYSRDLIDLLRFPEKLPDHVNIRELSNLINPADFQLFSNAVKAHWEYRTANFSSDLRITCGDGNARWFRARGKVIEWADDVPARMIGTLTNVDQEKDLEHNLGLNQTHFQAIADDEGVMICRYDRQSCFTYVNRTFSRFLGFEEDQLIGKPFLSFIHEDDRDFITKQIQTLSTGSLITDIEKRVRNSDGNFRWMRWRNHLLNDPQNDNIEFQAVGQDVTDTHETLELYHTRAEFDRLMVSLIGRISAYHHEDLDSIIEITLEELGNQLKVDRAYLTTFDLARETMSKSQEWCAKGIRSEKEFIQDLPFSHIAWWITKVKNAETILLNNLDDLPTEAQAEKSILFEQGILSLLVIPVQTRGKVIGFIGFDCVKENRKWQEYTRVLLVILAEAIANAIEGNSARQLIQMNEARERLFIDAIPALIIRINKQGHIIDHTVGCHGVLSQYVALHAPSQVNVLEDLFERPIADGIIQRVINSNENLPNRDWEFEINVAGHITTLEMKFQASTDNESILIFQDISEKKNLEQLKNDFINNATHEMRTPLTTILLMIDLFEKTEDNEKREQYWQILKGEVNRERMLIEDLLSVSRIEKGKYTSVRKPIDICASVEEAVRLIRPQADGAGLEIDVSIPAEPIYITGDANSCQIIFTNLLSNALKFSPGQQNIKVAVIKEDACVTISVTDHGIGIPQEDLPNIFARFFRGKNAVAGEIQGSGIGLFLVHHLSHDMGGEVTVESVIGQGTKFTVSLPCLVQENVLA
jgi:PAS domain S-box-containing protein